MIAKIEMSQNEIEVVLKNYLQVKLGTAQISDFKLLVKSKQNYRASEWENASVMVEGAAELRAEVGVK